jgi:hypothetical protein
LRFVGPLRLRLDSDQYPPIFHVKGGLRICR